MSGSLTGIRVVDLTNGFAGNSCAKLLADLGADVIKVESPDRGDFTRTLVPWVFQTFNRNKRSLAIDLRDEDGLAVLYRLLATSDVFVQSLRPGAAEALGLSREQVTARNPRLIHASLSGFGATGPSSGRKAVDVVMQAESGLSSIQGRVLPNTSFVDATAGLHLVTGIMAALLERERLGTVAHVTVNLLDSALYLESAPMAEYSATGHVIEPTAYARRFPAVGIFEGADGPFFLAAYWDAQWEQLCQVLGRPGLADDQRFRTHADRSEHVSVLRSELDREFGRRARGEWIAALEAVGIMSGAANTFADVFADAQVAENDSFEQIDMTDGRSASFVRPACRFVDRPWRASEPAPELGADTTDVLAAIGLSADEIARLRDAGVVAGPASAPV